MNNTQKELKKFIFSKGKINFVRVPNYTKGYGAWVDQNSVDKEDIKNGVGSYVGPSYLKKCLFLKHGIQDAYFDTLIAKFDYEATGEVSRYIGNNVYINVVEISYDFYFSKKDKIKFLEAFIKFLGLEQIKRWRKFVVKTDKQEREDEEESNKRKAKRKSEDLLKQQTQNAMKTLSEKTKIPESKLLEISEVLKNWEREKDGNRALGKTANAYKEKFFNMLNYYNIYDTEHNAILLGSTNSMYCFFKCLDRFITKKEMVCLLKDYEERFRDHMTIREWTKTLSLEEFEAITRNA